jgi:methionine biosynthesis protein MetW
MGFDAFPLDLDRTSYSYIERPNTVLVRLVEDQVIARKPSARILDIGCGAGANARALLAKHGQIEIQGVEPNERAAALAREGGVQVFHGMLHDWLATKPAGSWDAVVLSDVLEHIPDPVKFLRELVAFEGVRDAIFVVSVPNYAVWYNRVFTALGSFDYAWSGLYDRTHLRFFTRRSLEKLLGYLGLKAEAVRCTPSIVQSAAPILRRFFEDDAAAGDHLSLTESKAFKLYRTAVEPVETAVCRVWPELLGFQIVVAARRA